MEEKPMSEKEKSHKGMIYWPYEKELELERNKIKELLFEFNNLHPSKIDEKRKILEKLIGKIGQICTIEPILNCTYGYNVEIGENFHAHVGLKFHDCAKITIGDNVFVGPNVTFITEGHPLDVERRLAGLEYAYPVKIGSNCCIGAGVQILPGVTIGDNCVIGAGAVVNRDIPPNSFAAGVPAKVIRQITEADKEKHS